MSSGLTVYSIGHGARTAEELLTLLREGGIHSVVDVRAHPVSRRHPQFGRETLQHFLESSGMVYHWAGRQLGGLRTPVSDSPHRALADTGLRGYADHMETEVFRRGIAQLIHVARQFATVMLCAERLPEHCHRSLIADYLLSQGVTVAHLTAPGERTEHSLSTAARLDGDRLIYDRGYQGLLDLPEAGRSGRDGKL